MKRLILATATALIAAGSYALAAAPAFGASTPNAPADTVARVTDALGSNTSTSVVDPKVTVHPRRALFDVHLSPGEVVYRTVTVTNNGDAPARLALTAVQTAWGGHPENPDHLRFSIARQADTACTDASHPAAPWMPLGEVKALDRGQLEPQESGRYCTAVTLPADTSLPGDARSDINFLFDAIIAPSASGGNDGELAFTGAELSSVLLVALGVVSTGLTILLVRRRAITTVQSPLGWSSNKPTSL